VTARTGRGASASRTPSRTRFTPRAAILALVITAIALYAVVPFRTLQQQRDRLARLERQSQILEQQNAKLQARIQQLNDPGYLERYARECQGMVKPGEIAFIIVPKTGSGQLSDC
jgi:cell division protein FtsB